MKSDKIFVQLFVISDCTLVHGLCESVQYVQVQPSQASPLCSCSGKSSDWLYTLWIQILRHQRYDTELWYVMERGTHKDRIVPHAYVMDHNAMFKSWLLHTANSSVHLSSSRYLSWKTLLSTVVRTLHCTVSLLTVDTRCIGFGPFMCRIHHTIHRIHQCIHTTSPDSYAFECSLSCPRAAKVWTQ